MKRQPNNKIVNPHSVLIAFEKPSTTSELANWESMRRALPSVIGKGGKVEELADLVLLIPLQSGLQIASDVMSSAAKFGLRYRVLYFEQAPDWILSPRTQNSGGLFMRQNATIPKKYKRQQSNHTRPVI